MKKFISLVIQNFIPEGRDDHPWSSVCFLQYKPAVEQGCSTLPISLRKRVFGLFFICLLGFSLSTHASTQEEIFTQANGDFISGKNADAIQKYESLVSQKFVSAPLYYNLANAYFKDGKTGEAILNYERALWLNPHDADIKANLQFVRKNAGLFETPPAWWQAVPSYLTLNQWGILSLIWLTLTCVLVCLRKLRIRENLKLFVFISGLLWLVSFFSMLARIPDLQNAVILVPDTPLRIAPLENAASSFNIPAGNLVRIQKKRDSFYFIQAQDGKVGWVSEKQIQKVIP